MRLRRVFVGLLVVGGLTALVWVRPGVKHAHAQAADPVYMAGAVSEGGGNEDEAAYRYRANQSRHWRHVMIGGR